MRTEDVASSHNDTQYLIASGDLFGLLAIMLDYLTLKEVFDGLAKGTLQDDLEAMIEEMSVESPQLQEALDHLRMLQLSIADEEFTYRLLRQEYTRLFNHPQSPAIAFYEGAFVNNRYESKGKEAPDHNTLFINQAALDAERQYKRAGVTRSSEVNIPADCMATEMAFMQHLITLKVEARLVAETEKEAQVDEWLYEFKRLHLRVWMTDFFEACCTRSSQGYFQALGLLGQALASQVLAEFAEAGNAER